MVARVLFTLLLALAMAAAGVLWYAIAAPRAMRSEQDIAGAGPASFGAEAPEDAGGDVRFSSPSEVLGRLPPSSLALAPPLSELLPGAETSDGADHGGGPPSEPNESQAESPRLLPAPEQARPLESASNGIAPNQPAALVSRVEPAPTAEAQAAGTVEEELVRWMRALHDPALAGQAERELAARGFAPNHIELARRFTSPNASVRSDAVRSVISVRGIVARDWLAWATADPDRDVRLTAVTLMLTSGDPQLLGQVDRLALDDPDPHVRAVARRGLQQARADN